jgi:hypothetical protein
MRRLITAVLLAAALSLLSVASAFAHVHGVTPLNCPAGPADSVPNNANAGGTATDGTPADDANGGPIVGVIPIGTGNAPFTSNTGDAGQHSSHCQ